VLYIDDRLPRHPKIFRAGSMLGTNGPAQALAMYLDGLSYAREHLTDGFVPDGFVGSCGLVQTPQSVAKALSSRAVRLWRRVAGGYQIHDYLDWNKNASEIKEKREKDRIKKARQRARHAGNGSGESREESPRDAFRDSRARVNHVTTKPRTTPRTDNQPVLAAEPRTEARSKRPIFSCSRFVVWEWLFDDLRKLLGPHLEDFYLDEWFYTLSAKADAERLTLNKHDAGKWIYDETVAEAERRGLRGSGNTTLTPEDLIAKDA
jgi:hypothetical protein